MKGKIITSRLILKELDSCSSSDVKDLYRIFGDRNTALWADIDPFCCLQEARWYISSNYGTDGYTLYGVVDRETDFMVGAVQVVEREYQGVKSVTLGYAVNPYFGRRGFMTDAVKAVVEEIFSDEAVSDITLEILPFNIPSIRLALKCGFEKYPLKKEEAEKAYIGGWRLDEYVLFRGSFSRNKDRAFLSEVNRIGREEDLYESLAA
ncbi:MAG: GNAT family N-acetyltransferase [Bacteroidales bacterium]|nr:GNAT family N-acetyltransferase [Bacteroidales bacterium]